MASPRPIPLARCPNCGAAAFVAMPDPGPIKGFLVLCAKIRCGTAIGRITEENVMIRPG
jgi:hypothetical protein